MCMPVDFLSARPVRDTAVPADNAGRSTAAYCLDWRAIRRADRSCCCPARPQVIAIIPAAGGQPRPADLLLCWHHYRASRHALTAVGALLVGIDGTPIGAEEWPIAMAEPAHPESRALSPSSH